MVLQEKEFLPPPNFALHILQTADKTATCERKWYLLNSETVWCIGNERITLSAEHRNRVLQQHHLSLKNQKENETGFLTFIMQSATVNLYEQMPQKPLISQLLHQLRLRHYKMQMMWGPGGGIKDEVRLLTFNVLRLPSRQSCSAGSYFFIKVSQLWSLTVKLLS